MRSVALVTIFAFLVGCHEGASVPTIDPSKVEREVRKIEAAAKAIADALEAVESVPQPVPAPAVQPVEPSVE